MSCKGKLTSWLEFSLVREDRHPKIREKKQSNRESWEDRFQEAVGNQKTESKVCPVEEHADGGKKL